MRGIVVAAAVPAALALVQAGHAAGPSTYADTTGDAHGAVDIVQVSISNAVGGPFVIALGVADDPVPDDRAVYAIAFDVAPDRGAWTYATFAGAAPALLRPALSGAAVAGKTFRIPSATIVLDDGTAVRGQSVTCRVVLGGRALRGGSCRVVLPRSARGKLLVVTVRASHGGATIARTVRLRVR